MPLLLVVNIYTPSSLSLNMEKFQYIQIAQSEFNDITIILSDFCNHNF